MRDPDIFTIDTDELGTWIVTADGRRFPYVAGGDEPNDPDTDSDDDDGADDDNGDGDNDADTDDDQTAQQERRQQELQRIATRENRKGKRAGKREALSDVEERLGMSVDEAVRKLRGADDDQSGSQDRERNDEAKDREVQLIRKANLANVTAQLVSNGLDASKARRLARTVDLDLADEDLEFDDIEEAIEQLMADMPELFPKTEDDNGNDDGTTAPVDSTVRDNGRRRSQGGSRTAKDKARATLLKRHPHLTTKD